MLYHLCAPAPQLYFTQADHKRVRQACIATLRKERKTFEPFLDESEPWSSYIQKMANPDTRGGELEIQVVARSYEYAYVMVFLDA